MNKQGNSYTFIFATIMVVVVATLLAFVSQSLKPRQDRNVLVAQKSDILQSVNIFVPTDEVEDVYDDIIGESSYIVNFSGERVEGEALEVNMQREVRKSLDERNFPVYEATLESGEIKYILQVRGNGLWGPLWGYVSVNDDGTTIYGATFDHAGETPGLGAEIANRSFQDQFSGKKIFDDSGELVSIAVVKGGAPEGDSHAVDGISGGTITAEGLEDMLLNNFKGYEQFLKNIERNSHE
ncbi:NADH:ubiquinone reductase (Na(+)-transporting) subunit C [Marinilabiliaceae bacterium ANBcel2]|nr:NADH:ubiquinone reductase (Na(+)-transporting) subunit C [Marinilabiliaceae bacterium ANBcel2]